MIKKLQKKFIIISAVSVFSVVTIIFLFINIFNFISMNRQLDRVADRILDGGGVMDKPVKDPFVPPQHNDEKHFDYINPETPFSTRYFTIIYSSNQELVSVNTESIYSVDNEQALRYASQINKNKKVGWIDNYHYKVFVTPQGKTIIFLDGSVNIASIYQMMYISLIVLYLVGALVLLLIIILSKKVTRPIYQAYEKQKQFITDANHELKTPLTLILANTDIAETEIGENAWLNDIRLEGQKMTKLVNKLVELSRMDEDQYKITSEKIKFSENVKDISSEFKFLCQERGISLKVNVEENIEMLGDDALIKKLIYILLDNAVKYCDTDGEIKISLVNNKFVTLVIENTYTDIQNIEIDKLFDRFYRSDKARTYNGGFGIGLSLAKEIVMSHKGSIKAYQIGTQNIAFKVELRK